MSIIKQLVSLGSATLKQVAHGFPAASEKEMEERATACDGCEKLNREEYRCGVCNCFLKYKIVWRTSECPLDKWPKLGDK